jgi:DtxR family transcriptional regulator, Mn-dependent transcriptional regulator
MTVPEKDKWRTRAVEDFLRTVYLLQQTTNPVATTSLTEALQVTAPSIVDMFRRLGARDDVASESSGLYPTTPLIEHVAYHGVCLTPAGEQIALQVIRRRRLIELYLVQILGFTWDEVEIEADQLEHDISERLTERLAVALGNPEVDPHGEPIPSTQGTLPTHPDKSLADTSVGQIGIINRISNHSPQLLQYLAALGLRPGTEIRVVSRAPLGDAVTIQIGSPGTTYVLSTQVAAHLRLTDEMNTTPKKDNNRVANH